MDEFEQHFLEEARTAIAERSGPALTEAVSDFSMYCYKDSPPTEDATPLSKELIGELLKTIGSPALLNLDESFKLIVFFQNDWGRLTPELRLRVCETLAGLYSQFKDPTAHLVIAELIGDYLADTHSLRLLRGLKAAADETARAYVAYGYKRLLMNSNDPTVRKGAKADVLSLSHDPAELVRKEAERALAAGESAN